VKEVKLLQEGIDALRKNDSDIERLIAPRAEEVISRLTAYINEIELFNEAYGLVGAADTKELVIKHILDSLAPLGIILRLLAVNCLTVSCLETGKTEKPQIADAGSGAGLPGIPLALTLPNFDFTLIERMGRRAGFLWNTKASLSISNIAIEEGELEKTGYERFHLVTFRAFKPLEPKLLKTLFKVCVKGGVIAAYKGKREKIEQEMAHPDCDWEALPYKVPFLDEERHLLVIKAPKT
jgi:16S rRNA (guanine527-N7)-methyltransferase